MKDVFFSLGVIPRHDLTGPPLQLNGIPHRLPVACLGTDCLCCRRRNRPPVVRIRELLVSLFSSLMV